MTVHTQPQSREDVEPAPTPPERIPLSKFRARAGQIAERVARTNTPVIITRHGRPLVELRATTRPNT